jgi:hypothetical protein
MKYRYGIFFVMCRRGLHESFLFHTNLNFVFEIFERSKIGWGQERQVVLLLEFLKITISTIDFLSSITKLHISKTMLNLVFEKCN